MCYLKAASQFGHNCDHNSHLSDQVGGMFPIVHYSKKLEEQTFDVTFSNLVRILDILGVAR